MIGRRGCISNVLGVANIDDRKTGAACVSGGAGNDGESNGVGGLIGVEWGAGAIGTEGDGGNAADVDQGSVERLVVTVVFPGLLPRLKGNRDRAFPVADCRISDLGRRGNRARVASAGSAGVPIESTDGGALSAATS